MKRIISMLLALCMAVMSLNVVMAEGEIKVELGNVKAAAGEEIGVPVYVTGCENGISNFQFTINYDGNYLTFSRVANVLYTGTTIPNASSGEGASSVAIGSMDFKNSTVDGELITIYFNVNQTEETNVTSDIEIDVTEICYIDSSYNVLFYDGITSSNGSVLINEAEEVNPYAFVVDRDVTGGYESGAEIYADEYISYKAEQALSLNEGTSETVIGDYTYTNSLKSTDAKTSVSVDGVTKDWRFHSSITALSACTVTIATKAPANKLYAVAKGSAEDGFTSLAYYDGAIVTGNIEITLDLPAGQTVYIMGQGTNPEVYAINTAYRDGSNDTTETTTVTTTETTPEATTAPTTTETTTETTPYTTTSEAT
ncbi:MAG: hypothetical protein LIO44_04215, partial [Eubacterium sp.]|nr:hypothetical protein [Eubacterium sp.]